MIGEVTKDLRTASREPESAVGESFEGLVVWQKARELMLFVHKKVVPLLPVEEKWDLANQIRRSSKSVKSNSAEAHGRFHYRDAMRFCYQSRGSLSETENHLIDALDLGYVPLPLYQEGRDLAKLVQRLLNGYIHYLKQKKPGAGELTAEIPTAPITDH